MLRDIFQYSSHILNFQEIIKKSITHIEQMK